MGEKKVYQNEKWRLELQASEKYTHLSVVVGQVGGGGHKGKVGVFHLAAGLPHRVAPCVKEGDVVKLE